MLQIPDYGHVLVALSGGADSVALALLAKKNCARVTAAHVEHGIRAEASKRDMAFVQEFCKRHEIPLHTVCLDIPAMARENSVGLETAAREARYAFLRRIKEETGADVIATAHHMDDQMETVLMHLFRGSGTRGLEGMREKNGDLVRPLLGYTKAQLMEYLKERGEGFCEDETNRQDITPRNILRNRAIPQILSAYPRAAEAVARLAHTVRLEGEYLDKEAGRLIRRELCGWSVDRSADEALVKRAIAALIPDFDSVNDAYAGKAASLAHGWQARTASGRIYLIAPDAGAIEETPLADGITRTEVMEISAMPWGDTPSRDKMAQVFRRDALTGACIRVRRNGDFIRPLGMQGKKLLSDYMQDRRLPLPLRDFWPVLAVGNEVLWVIGVGVSETSKVIKDTQCVMLTAKYVGQYGGETNEI